MPNDDSMDLAEFNRRWPAQTDRTQRQPRGAKTEPRITDLEQRERALLETGDRLAVSWSEIHTRYADLLRREADLRRAWRWVYLVAAWWLAECVMMTYALWGGRG